MDSRSAPSASRRPRSLRRDHVSRRAAIEQVAPGHVRAVRRLMFDALTDDEVECLAHAIDKVLGSVGISGGAQRARAFWVTTLWA